MSEEIRVHVVKYPDRDNLVMRYKDPMSGRVVSRSTGATKRKEAEKAAAKWEAELQEGRWAPRNKTTWEGFREQYEDHVLPGLAERTAGKVAAVFNWIEAALNPQRLADLTESRLSYLQSQMRKRGLAEATIKGNMAHLAAALRWAERVGLIPKAPRIEMPKRAKAAKMMKGRPITGEEFERMLAKVPAVLTEGMNRQRRQPKGPSDAASASWRRYLTGLWLSGLRLAESLELTWDRDDKLRVDLDGRRPMLRIPAELEKGNQDRLLPMAPEFAEFLSETLPEARAGYVFNPQPIRPERCRRLGEQEAGRIIAKIGKAANVKVDADPRTGRVKYASAHDLRRSFGERWATRVMPPALMELMRHESIDTTLRYYVGRNAQATADVLWEAHERARAQGNILGNIGHSGASANEKPLAESSRSTRG